MHFRDLPRGFQVVVVSAGLALAGCGSNAPTPPKLELSEQEKQQVKELDMQRQSEWSSTNSGAAS